MKDADKTIEKKLEQGDVSNKAIDEIDSDQEVEDGKENKFLTFKIGDEQYGVGIEHVMEIIGMIKITPMPETQEFIKGVINLRGKVIPVMSVRLRFSMKEKEFDERTCIIVVRVQSQEIGLIVDTVSEVLEIPEDNIQAPPKISNSYGKKFVMGMGKVGENVNILLDLEKLLFEGAQIDMVYAKAS